MSSSYQLDHLQYLETESIHIIREVAAEFERPAILFSGGKDSICLLRLAEKAFRPSDIPMPLLNVDTGHHFPELNDFRDQRATELGAKLIDRKVEDAMANGFPSLRCSHSSRARKPKNSLSASAPSAISSAPAWSSPRPIPSTISSPKSPPPASPNAAPAPMTNPAKPPWKIGRKPGTS